MGRTAYTEPQCLYKGALYLYLYLYLYLRVVCIRYFTYRSHGKNLSSEHDNGLDSIKDRIFFRYLAKSLVMVICTTVLLIA